MSVKFLIDNLKDDGILFIIQKKYYKDILRVIFILLFGTLIYLFNGASIIIISIAPDWVQFMGPGLFNAGTDFVEESK